MAGWRNMKKNRQRFHRRIEKDWGQVQIFSFGSNLAVSNKPFKIPSHLPLPKGGEDISPF
jgi:hypothetical protein